MAAIGCTSRASISGPPVRTSLLLSRFHFGRFASMTLPCFGRADFGGHGIAKYVADSMFWLLGRGDEYRLIGGQGWPWSNQELLGPSYGFPGEGANRRTVGAGYVPEWDGREGGLGGGKDKVYRYASRL